MTPNDSCDVYTRLYYSTDFLWTAAIQHFRWQGCSTGGELTQQDTAKQCTTSQLTLPEQALTKLYQQTLFKEKEVNWKSGKLFSKFWMNHGTLICWKPAFGAG